MCVAYNARMHQNRIILQEKKKKSVFLMINRVSDLYTCEPEGDTLDDIHLL